MFLNFLFHFLVGLGAGDGGILSWRSFHYRSAVIKARGLKERVQHDGLLVRMNIGNQNNHVFKGKK